MPRKKYTAEQIIGMLREAEILLADGDTIARASRKLGITEQTYYRDRVPSGQARRARAENRRREGHPVVGLSLRDCRGVGYLRPRR